MGHIYPDILRNNIDVVTDIVNYVKGSLGPRGLNKMILDNNGGTIITSDGATILGEIDFEHPTAKVMCGIAETVEKEVGDGTITAVVLAGALLKEAEFLVKLGIHPTTLISGYARALTKAAETLSILAYPVSRTDKRTLNKVALTAMQGKLGGGVDIKDARLIVQAATTSVHSQTTTQVDLDDIKFHKVAGGAIRDSFVIDGIVVKGEAVHPAMPDTVAKARILLVMCPMEVLSMVDYSKWCAYPTGRVELDISKPKQIRQFLNEEKRIIRDMTDAICSIGANVVFCFRGIDEFAADQLARKNILAFKRLPRNDMEKLAKATGGTFVSNWNEATPIALGKAKKVHIERIGNESFTIVEGCSAPAALSIIIRGGTESYLNDFERTIRKGLCATRAALKYERIVMGGGSIEMALASRLAQFAKTQDGRIRLAIQAFTRALEAIPKTLAENAGLDPVDVIAELRVKHANSQVAAGVDALDRKVGNMQRKAVLEPLQVKSQVLKSATEAAQAILRVDTIITAEKDQTREEKARERTNDEDKV